MFVFVFSSPSRWRRRTPTPSAKGGVSIKELYCGDRKEKQTRLFLPPTYLGFENADFETLNTPEREKEREKKRDKKKARFYLAFERVEERPRRRRRRRKRALSLCLWYHHNARRKAKQKNGTTGIIKVFILHREREFWNAFCGRETPGKSRTQS